MKTEYTAMVEKYKKTANSIYGLTSKTYIFGAGHSIVEIPEELESDDIITVAPKNRYDGGTYDIGRYDAVTGRLDHIGKMYLAGGDRTALLTIFKAVTTFRPFTIRDIRDLGGSWMGRSFEVSFVLDSPIEHITQPLDIITKRKKKNVDCPETITRLLEILDRDDTYDDDDLVDDIVEDDDPDDIDDTPLTSALLSMLESRDNTDKKSDSCINDSDDVLRAMDKLSTLFKFDEKDNGDLVVKFSEPNGVESDDADNTESDDANIEDDYDYDSKIPSPIDKDDRIYKFSTGSSFYDIGRYNVKSDNLRHLGKLYIDNGHMSEFDRVFKYTMLGRKTFTIQDLIGWAYPKGEVKHPFHIELDNGGRK